MKEDLELIWVMFLQRGQLAPPTGVPVCPKPLGNINVILETLLAIQMVSVSAFLNDMGFLWRWES